MKEPGWLAEHLLSLFETHPSFRETQDRRLRDSPGHKAFRAGGLSKTLLLQHPATQTKQTIPPTKHRLCFLTYDTIHIYTQQSSFLTTWKI